jgi:hypothetical protein
MATGYTQTRIAVMVRGLLCVEVWELLLSVAPREMTLVGLRGELPQIQGKCAECGPDAKESHMGTTIGWEGTTGPVCRAELASFMYSFRAVKGVCPFGDAGAKRRD